MKKLTNRYLASASILFLFEFYGPEYKTVIIIEKLRIDGVTGETRPKGKWPRMLKDCQGFMTHLGRTY